MAPVMSAPPGAEVTASGTFWPSRRHPPRSPIVATFSEALEKVPWQSAKECADEGDQSDHDAEDAPERVDTAHRLIEGPPQE